MTRSMPSRRRGFTLVELLVSLVIAVIVIAGALALERGQQRSFQTTSGDRYLQEMARIAIGHLANNLQQAGFGVDPALAFDFGPMSNVRMDRAYQGQTFSTTSSPTGDGTACTTLCRDGTTGPDEIVFFSRDPAFGPHPLTVAATSASASLTIAGPLHGSLLPGQILQVACYGGSMTWAYVQVGASPTVNGDGTVTVPLVPSASATFPTQNAWLDDPCFGSVATLTGGAPSTASLASATEVFKIDRFHYFIQSYDAAGVRQPWGTPGARPYLMLDQGLTDAGGNPIAVPVAPDVEDIQFAYVFPNDAVTPLVGSTAGAGITDDDAGINLAPASGCPAYSDPLTSPTRQNHHPGNIGAVRVSVVVRSASPDFTRVDGGTLPAAGNRSALAGPPGYRRLLVDTTVDVRNLGALAPYFPAYGAYPAASGSRQLNVGGG